MEWRGWPFRGVCIGEAGRPCPLWVPGDARDANVVWLSPWADGVNGNVHDEKVVEEEELPKVEFKLARAIWLKVEFKSQVA